MLPAALAGAALLLAADIAVRIVPAAIELKVGVVTALIGVPFFLMMIFRERRLLEGVAVVSALLPAEKVSVRLSARRSWTTQSSSLSAGDWSPWSAPTAPARPH